MLYVRHARVDRRSVPHAEQVAAAYSERNPRAESRFPGRVVEVRGAAAANPRQLSAETEIERARAPEVVLDGRLVLDFNFAYNPSCAYNPRWVCPLTPRENRLPVAIPVGEQVYTDSTDSR